MKWRHEITCICFMIFLIGMMMVFLIIPKQSISTSERRKLAKYPDFSVAAVMDESYMEGIEKYLLDHFPKREFFRRIKAMFAYDVLQQKENNDIYVVDKVAAKLEYPLKETSIVKATVKIKNIQNKYFPDMEGNVFFSIIPDKNYFLAKENGMPSMDYEKIRDIMKNEMTQVSYIDIMDVLSAEDFYATDTHWKQECLGNVVDKLAQGMGVAEYIEDDYTMKSIPDFYGVYYGQSALPLSADTIVYLENEAIASAKVWSLEDGDLSGVYTPDRDSMDDYDVFLGGPQTLLKIESPVAKTDKRLIVFRDSFGSSLVPLFLDVYKEIIVIDTRYIKADLLGDYIDFDSDKDNTQVLFIYNTLLLNNSSMLR